MAQLQFNATNIEPQSSFEPLPTGDYPVIIKDSEMKPTKNGLGSYLELTLEVIDGNAKGRLVWDRLNLENQNHVAVEIAQKQLSAICHAIGKLNIADSSELHNIPLVAKVAYREAKDGYEPSNDVKSYKAYGNAKQPVQPQHSADVSPQVMAAQQPAAQNRPAWG